MATKWSTKTWSLGLMQEVLVLLVSFWKSVIAQAKYATLLSKKAKEKAKIQKPERQRNMSQNVQIFFLRSGISWWALVLYLENMRITTVLLICQEDNLVGGKNYDLLKVEIIQSK